MNLMDIVDGLKHLSNPERLAVIEVATRLVREELTARPIETREEKNRRLRAAALAARDLYEPGGELTEWIVLDTEDFLDDTVPR